jgi:hypothetical protein
MGRKHLFIMILCCLIPMAGLVAIRLFQIPVSTGAAFGLMLLCPISHVLLMKFMMDGHNHDDEQHAHHEHVSPTPSFPERHS